MNMLAAVLTPDTLVATLRMATPLVLVAIAAAISLKAGLFNIAIEGLMLVAAFVAVVLTARSGSLAIGTLGAIAGTIALSLAYGVVTINLKADAIIAGLGINMFALGLTSWLLQAGLNSPGGYRAPDGLTLPVVDFTSLPVVGSVVARQNVLTVATWVLIVLAWLFVHRSKFGLRMRAVGEHPLAASTAGISSVRWRYIALALAGLFAALAGIALSMGSLGLFTKGMTAGRGFIGFAAASFALGNIPGTVAVSYLFALLSSLSIRVDGFGIPTRFLQMIPYLMTIVALMFARRRKES
jgi:simple sugar transport system permease protein